MSSLPLTSGGRRRSRWLVSGSPTTDTNNSTTGSITPSCPRRPMKTRRWRDRVGDACIKDINMPQFKAAVGRAGVLIQRLEHESRLFRHKQEVVVPAFDEDEIRVGKFLGEGESGAVYEVGEIISDEKCDCTRCARADLIKIGDSKRSPTESERFLGGGRCRLPSEIAVRIIDDSEGETGEDDSHSQEAETEDSTLSSQIGFMKKHCRRGKWSRYAIKKTKEGLPPEQYERCLVDLALEAKFLKHLSHPNIVKMRATGKQPGHDNFFMIMDCLTCTLAEQIDHWIIVKAKDKGFLGFSSHKQRESQQSLLKTRLLAAFDIARAMKYLHSHKVLHRDIKPENVGFDVRGNAKVFDFDCAKELLLKDLVSPPDQYRATGATGSRRYMAPEVALCKDYGLSADVYSYAMLFWQLIALKLPFEGMSREKHTNSVILKGHRPRVPKSCPALLKEMLQTAWSPEPRERPSFEQICDLLTAELVSMTGLCEKSILDRTAHLENGSITSRRGDSSIVDSTRERTGSFVDMW